MKNNNEEFLPIGSIVILKNGNKKIMIDGYLATNENNITFDYSACLFPEGFVSSDKILLFNHEQIKEIYFLGYNDNEASHYRKQLNTLINSNNNLNSAAQNNFTETNI